jgi:hypothetical protein
MSEEEKKVKTTKPASRFMTQAVFFLVLGGVLAGGGVYSFARRYPDVLGLRVTISQEEEAKAIVEAVSKIMDVPTDEAPTIKTVTSFDESSNETAFKNTKSGDKIISYLKNKRVILYRPSDNKIIDVGFLTASQSATATATVAPASKSMSVFIFNGTETVGATKSIELKLLETYSNFKVSGRGVAAKTDYPETLIIDIAGNRADDVKKIAQDMGITVGALPEGEKIPVDSDFLIIVGANSLTASPSATPTTN